MMLLEALISLVAQDSHSFAQLGRGRTFLAFMEGTGEANDNVLPRGVDVCRRQQGGQVKGGDGRPWAHSYRGHQLSPSLQQDGERALELMLREAEEQAAGAGHVPCPFPCRLVPSGRGGPRWGPLAERMRSTRARFKLCLRWCKSHEHQLRAQSLADKLESGDSFNFWRGVRSITRAHTRFPYEWITIFAYLGHVISHGMTDDDDIIKQTTKLLVVGNNLQRKFSYCSREVKMELFRSHCYSIYCNSLWSRYKVATMNCLKVCHNDIFKRLLGLPRWCSSSLAFARNGVNNLDVIRRHSVFSLRSRVELSTNSIITSVRQSSAYVCGPIQQRWLGLLFVQNVG
ncbi:hypothetical protein GWK47_015039 [Chionoecetes opilio]|uniref:Uncharacterized protein n=1 Tax=Chionoecetes opilio TaxID=41210 RepID=A0A8J4XSA3_CHIOP|nr:hypothetical protein GWK47_015039 [Chionoecetes opilio]